MDINSMTEEQIKQHLLDRKVLKEQEISKERDELFDKYKDAKYVITYYLPNKYSKERGLAFGKVISVEKENDYGINILFKSRTIEEDISNKSVTLTIGEESVDISIGDTDNIEIITKKRYNELKTLFDELYNDKKFDNLFNKLKENE